MSIHTRPNGTHQVRWRENGRQRSRTFTKKTDARLFDAEITRRLQLGPHLARELDRHAITLREFVQTGFRDHAVTLAKQTREGYAWALEHHLRELLDEPLMALDVPTLAAHQQHLIQHGRTANTARESMARLSGILQIAVEHGLIQANPCRGLRKIKPDEHDEPWALAPVQLERIIAGFTGRDRIITVLGGYFGLRPLEIRLLPWANVADDSITVGRARTKSTAARTRVVQAPAAARPELKRWRLESGMPSDREPVIGQWSAASLARWARLVLSPAVERETGRDDSTLYLVRHSHASMLHYAGYTVPSAARRMGHGPALHVRTYAKVIDALEGRERYRDLDALIAAARAELGHEARRTG